MTAIVGVPTGDWSARELLWAIDAKRREQWSHWAHALAWIVNRMPNMSNKPRQPVTPDQINPYVDATSGIRLSRSNPHAEAALDAWAERVNQERRR